MLMQVKRAKYSALKLAKKHVLILFVLCSS